MTERIGETSSISYSRIIADPEGISIFLEELNLLGEQLYSAADSTDKTDEISQFLEFLLAEARRKVGEKITLEYISSDFSVGLVLVAKARKAEKEGIAPYLQAIDFNIKRGCDSIYVIAYNPSFRFLNRLSHAVSGDERLSVVKVKRTKTKFAVEPQNDTRKIILLRRNSVFGASTFNDKIDAAGIKEGDIIEGTVLDISENTAIIDALGVNAIIRRPDCGWQTITKCEEVLCKNEKLEFLVKSIDRTKDLLELSLRLADEDPWKSQNLPKIGEAIDVEIIRAIDDHYMGQYIDNIEVEIPRQELAWLESEIPRDTEILKKKVRVLVYEKSAKTRTLRGSVRQLEKDPWPMIQEQYPKGKEFLGKVIEVTQYYVKIALPNNGVTGIIPADYMIQAGYEYADFANTVVVGQGLEVVVSKVFLKKKRLRLNLKRNTI